MEINEYFERQRSIVEGFVSAFLKVFQSFRDPALSDDAWYSLLRLIFPMVDRARRESAILGREFYDSQREIYRGTERFDVDLASYKFEWFAEAMEPSRSAVKKPGASPEAITSAALRAVKEVENGGRKTVLRAVEDENKQSPRNPVGWARVATGRETCGFCMMMVSRGPTYFSAETAGINADDETALELIESGDQEALNEAMKRWHPGCDCKVVPVFDRKNWAGRDAYLRAEQLWIEATRGYRGKDALNALRRALESGDVDAHDFAVAA